MNILSYIFGSIFGFSLIWIPILHASIVVLFGIYLISARRPVGVAFAWFLIVILLPLLGIALYILIGERPVAIAKRAMETARAHSAPKALGDTT